MPPILSWCSKRSAPHQRAALLLALLLLTACAAAACQPAPRPAPPAATRDSTPRIAVISAFAPEIDLLRKSLEGADTYVINGRSFSTGRLSGQDVLLFLSGESMVNAAMTAQLAIDHFNLRALLVSGIAGGVNPDLSIGDVVVPAEWAEYQEQLFARQSASGWDTGLERPNLGNYGMMFPRPVGVVRQGGQADAVERKFWFAADPTLLAAARTAAAQVQFKKCPVIGACLPRDPRVVTGGRGVSGPTFVDNAEYRAWVWQTFQADALDMESAAVAHVAYANGLPFLAFRSLSDLAGGGPGQNEVISFFQLAADNAAQVVISFLHSYPK